MKHQSSQSGFAMLFTILIVSLILSIAISISNLTLKQAVLSNLAKDSQIAFYQADAVVECGMYRDTVMNQFPDGATVGTGLPTDVPGSFGCGNLILVIKASTKPNYFEYTATRATSNEPCFSIIFDKTHANDTPIGYSRVQGTGYNLCGNTPRRVERSLEVKY